MGVDTHHRTLSMVGEVHIVFVGGPGVDVVVVVEAADAVPVDVADDEGAWAAVGAGSNETACERVYCSREIVAEAEAEVESGVWVTVPSLPRHLHLQHHTDNLRIPTFASATMNFPL